ncbi:hypothetical protein BKA66DRAFT_539445 [Pyrenochaeta sp. MPI-SDFR-AT-0127]|nr:hypothetical protein BKA66DRAFT_539445 [Pyrenochaeta sp. MPI-SDFR-AT-0127]
MFGPLSRLRRTHYHILDLNSSRTILDSITMAMREIRLPLVEFRAIDFTSTSWQSALGSTIPMLSALVELPNMGHLTRLDLELDMFSDNSNSAMNALVKIIDKNCALQNLKLSTGPRLEQTFRIRHQHWSPFMHLLGSSPSFRLRSLDLEGLITSGTMMLDQIIHAHAGTLRDIVLDNTNFGTPNSLRNFFMELSKTDLELFAIRNFWFHDNSWLSGSTWSYHHRPDEVLDCFDDEMLSKDEAYLDWVDISWESASYRKWIRWDNRDGRHGNFWMKECLMNVVEMVDCCDMDDD